MYKKKCKDCGCEFDAIYVATAYCDDCAPSAKRKYFKRYYEDNKEKYKKYNEERKQKLLESKTNNDKQS